MASAWEQAADEPPQSIVFENRLGSFIGLAIANLLLTIITLGIYRFWAKTRIRRYLWEHTSFAGDPLEYRGRGLELLVGALLGLVIIGLPVLVISFIEGVLRAGGHELFAALLQLVPLAGVFYLVGVGLYRSERYMLSRTSWRGIRGGMTRRGWSYGWLYIRMQLLSIVTLGFASPYVSTRLWNVRMGDAMFGSANGKANAEWRPLFGRFVLAYIGALVIYGAAIALLLGSMMRLGAAVAPGTPPDPHVLLPLLGRVYGMLILASLLAGFMMLSYHAALWRERFAKTRLDTLGFEFTATTGAWLRYYLGNILIVVLTLGLGLMIMSWRAWSFYMRHIRTVGSIDTNALLQTQLAAPTQGDGIADALGFSLTPF